MFFKYAVILETDLVVTFDLHHQLSSLNLSQSDSSMCLQQLESVFSSAQLILDFDRYIFKDFEKCECFGEVGSGLVRMGKFICKVN